MISISTPHYPSVKDMMIQPAALQPKMEAFLKQKKNKNVSLTEVLLHLQEYEAQSSLNGDFTNLKELKQTTISMVERYHRILSELKCLDSWKISGVGDNLTRFSLSVVDSSGYKHRMDLKVPDNYPQSPPVVEFLDLPDTVMHRITSCDTITQMYGAFVGAVGELEVFWRIYDEIRGSCWVIDPAVSHKKDTYCRIVIDQTTSIIVTLNPLFPNACPEVKFLGPEKDVLPLRTNMQRNLKIHGWDEGQFFVDNLTTLMEVGELPLAPSQNSGDQPEESSQLLVDGEECMICFALRSDDDLLPAKICNNEKCASLFHVSCLIQWLHAVPTNEPSFNLISGDCPHCGEKILCPIKVA
ncbi:E3 ubiquitin-protein ligase FANCL [Nilaparvata lugens]|uniref:E3 ubiquitin-protein ligase FANCL n=1 Tax=Nilaparvata lugens TaxID=108931 RepID=UPI00193E536E|nr:E3 ubiquitin-protein ligase FANCL [Nilaparvata lugens]